MANLELGNAQAPSGVQEQSPWSGVFAPEAESFLPARRYASAGYRDRNVSVRLSVRHAPVLCQNEES